MKRAFVAASIAVAVACGPAHANIFGQYVPAPPLPVNEHLFGAYLGASDDVVSLLAQLRLSFYPGVDFGFQGGLSRIDFGSDKRTALKLGGDLRFAVLRADAQLPIDLSLGGALGVESGDDYSILSLGPTAVASRTFKVGSSALSPYAGIVLQFSSIDVGPLDDTDFSIPLRLGAELAAAPGLRFCGELDLRLGDDFNDDLGFSVGVNLPF